MIRKVKHEIDVDTPFINNLAVLPLEKRAHFGLSGEDGGDELSRDLLLELVLVGDVPLLQPQLALSREQKHKLHLQERSRSLLIT